VPAAAAAVLTTNLVTALPVPHLAEQAPALAAYAQLTLCTILEYKLLPLVVRYVVPALQL